MGIVSASITTSLDGYITGPDDGPGRGLGIGGERLHYWVFGREWSSDDPPSHDTSTPDPVDQAFLDAASENAGAVIAGRSTFESAGRWGGSNVFGVPLFVLTHRVDDDPPAADSGFEFVDGFDAVLRRARDVAGEKDVNVMGGADTIRQALAAGVVDTFHLTVAPVVLGAGKRLFDGFDTSLELEQTGITSSPWATHLDYRIRR